MKESLVSTSWLEDDLRWSNIFTSDLLNKYLTIQFMFQLLEREREREREGEGERGREREREREREGERLYKSS